MDSRCILEIAATRFCHVVEGKKKRTVNDGLSYCVKWGPVYQGEGRPIENH